jgi:hypothetical protein
MKLESGQASIVAILVLPLVLFILGGLALLAYALSVEAKATLACRTQVAQSQMEVAKAASRLMQLNELARQLEGKRQAAIRALNLTISLPNPAAKVAAAAALKAIETAQIPVMRKQLYWLAKGRQASMALPVKARRAVELALPQGLYEVAEAKHIRSIVPKFQMQARPYGARTPIYTPASTFAVQQNGGIRWQSLPLESNVNQTVSANQDTDPGLNWLAKILTFLPGIEIGCSLTLNPTPGGGWSTQPTEDKLSSNSSSS